MRRASPPGYANGMRFVLALALVACSSSKSAPPAEGTASGSASTCPDDEIAKRGDASLAASVRYMDLLEKLGTAWNGDCEAARLAFIALEPEGKRFMDAMMLAKEWGEKLTPECRDRAKERWAKGAAAPEIEARAPKVQGVIATILDKCEAHPGFKDAVGKGLRVMRKKKG